MTITRETRNLAKLEDPTRFDLGRLTAGEKLFLWRHRQPSPSGQRIGQNGWAMSQAEAATALGLSWFIYNRLELGQRTEFSLDEAEGLLAKLGVLEPSLGELCFLARRRSGLLLKDIESGISRPYFHACERAGDPRIVELWEKRGYRFP